MATFYNQATLSYNGISTTSNITTGEIVEVLSATKTAVLDNYSSGDDITYVISIVNTGTTPYNNLTITDDLGEYTLGTNTLTPLTYVDGSINYYVNGSLQTAPTVSTANDKLVITPVNVPAGGNATIIYEASANQYAPMELDSTITNTATITSPNLANPITTQATVSPVANAVLTISKSVSPTVISENGELTYTFIIQNLGNTAATATDNVVITDTFNPILDPVTVSFNDVTLTEGTHYTYSEATGQFATIPGSITIPAATYTQNETTGAYTINPGVGVLKVTGTV